MQSTPLLLLIGLLMVVNAFAMERKASWYMNNYQIKAYINSIGYNGLRFLTYGSYLAMAVFLYLAWSG